MFKYLNIWGEKCLQSILNESVYWTNESNFSNLFIDDFLKKRLPVLIALIQSGIPTFSVNRYACFGQTTWLCSPVKTNHDFFNITKLVILELKITDIYEIDASHYFTEKLKSLMLTIGLDLKIMKCMRLIWFKCFLCGYVLK